MTCEEFQRICDAYVDGAASNGGTASVEAHASECAECEHALLERLTLGAAAEAVLRDLAPPAPASMLARIEALLPPQPATQPDACYLIGPDVSALLDGALPAEDAEYVRAHLDDCRECARGYRFLSALEGAFARMRVEPSPRLAKRLHVLAAQHAPKSGVGVRSSRRWLAPWMVPTGALAAAGLCLFLLGVHVGAGHRQAPTPTMVARSEIPMERRTADSVAAPSTSLPAEYATTTGTDGGALPSQPVGETAPMTYVANPSRSVRYMPRRAVHVSYGRETARAAGRDELGVRRAPSGPAAVPGADGVTNDAATPPRSPRLGLDMRAWDHLVVVPGTASGSEPQPVVVSEPAYVVVEAETVHLATTTDDEAFEPSRPARLY